PPARLVPRRALLQARSDPRLEPTTAIVAIHRHSPPTPAADNQILPPVSVHVIPRHSRPQLAQLPRQQRLPLKIVELFLMMAVLEQLTHILVNGLMVDGGWWMVGTFG